MEDCTDSNSIAPVLNIFQSSCSLYIGVVTIVFDTFFTWGKPCRSSAWRTGIISVTVDQNKANVDAGSLMLKSSCMSTNWIPVFHCFLHALSVLL